MYGIEKSKTPFTFDLEKDLKKNTKKKNKLFQEIEGNINEIKSTLRSGGKSKEFEELGIILHGYTALKRVLERAVKS